MIAGRVRIAASILAGLLCAMPASASAASTYVDEDSSNVAGGCFTPATACKTIAGLGGGLASAGPGDTVFVDGGTYDENFTLGFGKSLVHQEFGAPDAPAIIDGAASTAILVADGTAAGTVQGLTIRGSEGSLKAFGPVTVTGNTFDEDGGTFTTTEGSLHLEDDAAQYEVTDNTFLDPTPSDDRFGIKAVLSGTATPRANGNHFTGLQEGIHAQASPKRPAEISRNTFTGIHSRNDETEPGIAIDLTGIQALVERNTISSPNVFQGETDGVSATNGSLTLYRNRIRDHSTAVKACGNSFATLNGDVLWNNGVGVFEQDCPGDDPVRITSSVLWGNSFADVHMIGGAVQIDSSILSNPVSKAGSALTPFVCTIAFSRGPTTGGTDPDGCDGFQTSADPGFVNPAPAVGDFHLTPSSPMVDAGNPGMSTFMVFDPDDDPRLLDGDCDGVALPDIGADELKRDCSTPQPPTGGPGPSGKAKKCKRKRKDRGGSAAAAKKRKCKRKRKRR